jgi:hypothetical protein
MENIFTSIARRETTLSPLMEDREKLDTDKVIELYPDGFTVINFDMISTGLDTYPILIIKEDSSKFIFGGAIMKNICDGWVEQFEGDIEAASKALESAGGVRMKFEKARTKNGNNLTKPIIL